MIDSKIIFVCCTKNLDVFLISAKDGSGAMQGFSGH
jgi:hypothetical protein